MRLKVSANDITLELFDPAGNHVGNQLYNVTAFAFGRNDDTADLYDDVDATPSFDYALGGPAGGGAAC
jgi:hypothetical protein